MADFQSDAAFFKVFPKLELHAHLNGSLSEETLKKLCQINGNDASTENWPAEESVFANLTSCFDVFSIAHNLTKTAESVRLAALSTIQDFANDHVIYLELRSTPRHEEHMTKRQCLQAIVDAVIEARQTIPTTHVTVIVSINRSQSVKDAEENVSLALEFAKLYSDIVVGLDFSGDPAKGVFAEFIPSLKKARDGGLKITLHCAEIDNRDEVIEMVKFHPDRIGHLTFPPPEALSLLTLWQIPIELCVTSNIKCGTVSSAEHHQFGALYQKLPVILSTDDKGVFSTSLSAEYELVHKVFHLSRGEVWSMNLRGVDFCFAPDEAKDKLRTILSKWKEQHSMTDCRECSMTRTLLCGDE